MGRHWMLLLLLATAGCKPKETAKPVESAAATEEPADVDLTVALASKTTEVYDVSLSAPATVKAGEDAELTVTLQAKGGMHVNPEYPVNFRPIRTVNAVKYGREKYDLLATATRTPCEGAHSKDACSLTAPVPFSIDVASPRRIEGVFAFSVCDKNRCLIEKATLGMDVVAK